MYGNIQAVFDYPEEGVPESAFAQPLERAITRIDRLLATARAGRISQRGAKLALIGRPNAGKSSLLNALLGFQRSIVSDIPGTTRDYLEAPLTIGGVPVTAIDTAGIRSTDDLIEASGVAAAKEIAANADLSLLLVDLSSPLSEEDRALVDELDQARTLLVVSKTDLPHAWNETNLGRFFPVSAVTGEGLDALKEAIRDKLLGDSSANELWLTSERHVQALTETKDLLERAKEAPDDLASLDLEDALRTLAGITGRGEIAEETLAHIFENFCVGK